MIIKRKTQIILALLISSIFLFQNCAMLSRGTPEGRFLERKHGAKLLITKKDGWQIAGELITVKESSLLLLNTEGWEVSVGIADIRAIRSLKRSKAFLGAGIGAVVAGGGGVLAPHLAGERDPWYWSQVGVLTGAAGLLMGAIIGALAGTDKKIHFEGMTDLEIEEALDYLGKQARIREYR